MKTRLSSLLLAGLVAVCCLIGASKAAVFSIDFGSEWIKVALVKPGVPMEIVLNKESKRKTAAVVALRNDERLFGDAALNTAVKFPKSAYRYLQLLIGQKFESPLVQKYKEWFPFYELKKDEERGTVLFQHDKDTVYSVEELVGMLFNYSRQLVEDYAGIPIKDVVITVPPFFTQAQRRSLIHAANLVGLNVIQLMGDSAGAGLNYGVFRQQSFNTTPQYVMLYDMGSVSTVVTVIEYRKVQVKEGSSANMYPQLLVKGVGYDRLLGGFEIDTRLQKHLAKVFEGQAKSTRTSVYDSPRAMAKLLKEAKRVKQVLSANTDHFAQIEGLLEDVDFRAKVTRAELEKICADLFDRVQHPVRQALESADMTMDEIDSVIIIGGGTRVPKIQELLLEAVGKSELSKNLNADEAVALGAVYQGAGHSKMFRVKKFIVKESTLFPIQVAFSRETKSEDGGVVTKTVKRTLFQRGNSYPQKKVLTFNRYSDDFPFQVFYGDLDFLSKKELKYIGRLNISEVFMSGVSEALSSNQDGDPKGIKAHFRMDGSGLLNLDYVQSLFEYPDGKPEEQSTLSKIGSTISSFFGGGATQEEEKKDEQEEGEEVAADGDGNETVSSSDSHSTKEDATPQPPPTQEPDSVDEQETDKEEREETEQGEGDKAMEGETEMNGESDSIEEERENEESESRSESDESAEETETEEERPQEGVEQTQEGAEQIQEGAEQTQEEAEQTQEGEEQPQETSEEEADREGAVDGTGATNKTDVPKEAKKEKKSKTVKKEPAEVKESMVKVNLTADVIVLDLPNPSEASTTVSTNKLAALQQRDDDKIANEQAKNNLESHIFETKDAMYSEAVVAVTNAEQRETILAALTEAGDWMEDEGYFAETSVYKSKLRELKRASRAVFKRVSEMEMRPKLLERLNSSLNVSHDFLARMKNISIELQIFTEVEMTTLETLIEETEEWMTKMIAQQKATPSYEEPVLLSHDIEEQTKRLDREILYLLNKLRSHPPPKPKNATSTNTTNTTSSTDKEKASTSEETLPTDETTPIKEKEAPTEEEPEILELPEAADSAQTATDPPSPSSEEKHQEL